MILVLFRSRLTEDAASGDDYTRMNARMHELAQGAPGFVGVKSYTADDGERLTVVRWQDMETLRQWREDPRHRAAQEKGRSDWYEFYVSEVAELVRESRFERETAKAAS